MRERKSFSGCGTVFAIIPVHNRWEQTRRCLESLAAQTYRNLRIVLVDDGSTDGTREFVRRDHPEVALVEGDGTLWWAGGVNRGIQYSMGEASADDFLLILNNDLSFDEDFIAALCRESGERGRAALVPVSVDALTGTLADTGFLVDWKNVRIVPALGENEECAPQEPDAFTTRGLLLPVPFVSAAGRLREKELPHYLSDLEYTLRIREMGLPIFRSQKAIAFLDTSTSGCKITPGTRFLWHDLRDHLFDYRSPSNIVHWMRFLKIRCPRRYLTRWVLSILLAEAKFAVKAFLRTAGTRA